MSATIKRLRRYVTYTLNDIFWRIDSKFVGTEYVSTDIDIPAPSLLNAPESTCRTLPSGTKEWRNSKGQLHRVNGPAIEYATGGTAWYIKGLRHRENLLPAIEYADGGRYWHLEGKELTEAEHTATLDVPSP